MNLSGFRLVRWKYGLVVDFPGTLTIVAPYYFALVFLKRASTRYECFPATEVYSLDLSFLGKIVSSVERKPNIGISKIVFIDGTSLSISS
jgi:hypothetical protein